MTVRVFLDACVLYPPLVRSITLSLAEAGVLEPLYSTRVLNEWRLAIARKQGPDREAAVEDAIDRLCAAFPDGLAEPEEPNRWVLPDPDDVHVLAAAHAGGADVLLTFNLRDFPASVMRSAGVEARHPDGFLWQLLSEDSETVGGVIASVLYAAGAARSEARKVLKRARLPRLGKAIAALGDGCQAGSWHDVR